MSGLTSIGTSAMFASYAALQATGQNISNVNTPGYSRQQVQLETAGGQYTGAGFFGRGVQVATVARAYNQFLATQANGSQAQASADASRLAQLQQLETAFPTGQNAIGSAAGDLLNAFVDVGNNPQDPSARQVVLAKAQDLVSRFNAASGQISALQAGTAADIKNTVATVNGLTAQVAVLNQQIAKAQGLGQPPNDLLDQRDQLIAQINSSVQVTSIPASDGTVGLFIGGGQQLVLGSQALTLSTVPDGYAPSQVRLAVNDPGGNRQIPAGALTGGSIAGLMRFQDQDLVDARNLVGQMAAALGGRVNAQQALGLDLGQPPGAGAPLFATGAPQVLPNTGNARAANGNFAASVSLTVGDPTQLQASDYELSADPSNPGSYLLKRLSDGLTRQVSPGTTIDGFTIGMSVPPPGPNDRYLLRPVGAAASGMTTALADPNGIAAASPVTATVGAANTGTASVASLVVTSPTINPALTANISFTDGSGNYNWSMVDAGNNVVSSGTGSWTPGQPISLNGFQLSLNGVPNSGDTLQVAPTRLPAAKNGNALALLGLRDETMVGRLTLPNGSGVGGQTVTDAYAQALANIGVRVQSAQSASDTSAAVAQNAQTQLANADGVNLDEEASRLIQFQQSYQAAAKVLQVAQTVFDTLLQAVSN